MLHEKTSFDKVLEEHRELRRLIQELRRFLEGPQPEITEEDSHSWAADLMDRLVKLHRKLFPHFREEDRSGVLEELAERFPRALRTVQTLQAEHAQLLGELRGIVTAAMIYAEDKLPPENDLRGRTLRLIDQLTRHEEAETDLIQRLYYEDLGGGD
jgi:hypothetical protein